MDEDWHSICQAIYQGVEEQEQEVVYHKYTVVHKAINFEQSGGDRNAKALWWMRDVKAGGEARCGRGSEQHIKLRSAVRHALWEA